MTVRDTFPWADGAELYAPNDHVRELLLTETEGYFTLKYYAPLIHNNQCLMPAGLYFDRGKQPLVAHESPLLATFPPPYHVCEVMMANRGWGGKFEGEFSVDALQAIGGLRKTPFPLGKVEIARVLGYTEDGVRALFHLFTPFNTGDHMLLALRRHYFRKLGFNPGLADAAVDLNKRWLPRVDFHKL